MAQWDEQNSNTYGTPQRGNGSAMTPEESQMAQMQEMMENARNEIERYVNTAADFIRARPVACVVGAIGVGFLIGKIASRK